MLVGLERGRHRERLLKDTDLPLRLVSLSHGGTRGRSSLSIAQMPVPVPMSRIRLSRSVFFTGGNAKEASGDASKLTVDSLGAQSAKPGTDSPP